MATKDNRGTDEYTAPEILHARQGIPTYWNAVDIYGIGLILHELFTGHRVFYSRADAMKYPPRIPELQYAPRIPVIGPYTHPNDVASAYATRIVSTPFDHINDKVRSQLTGFWNAVKSMELTNPKLLGEVNSTQQSRLEEINTFLKAMLHHDPSKRPPIDVLEHHFKVNTVRSMLENDVV